MLSQVEWFLADLFLDALVNKYFSILLVLIFLRISFVLSSVWPIWVGSFILIFTEAIDVLDLK